MATNDASAAVVQARQDVERISRGLYDAERAEMSRKLLPLVVTYPSWECISEDARDRRRMVVTALLEGSVIFVGRRPETGPPPMEGQTCLPTT